MRPTTHLLASALLVIAASLAVGCATPAPLVRLDPKSPDVVWVAGRASVAREEGGVRVGVAFEHQDGANLGLRVEVANGTGQPFIVDPRELTYTTCGGDAIGSCGLTMRVIDPEEVLATLQVQMSREQADAANSAAFHGTLVILTAVTDVATVASGHADSHTGLGTAAAVDLMESDTAARSSSLGSLSSQEEFWSNEVLRRTTVFPGHGTAGRIYVPTDLRATVVWIHIRAAGHIFSIPFRQQVTRIVPRSAAPYPGRAGY